MIKQAVIPAVKTAPIRTIGLDAGFGGIKIAEVTPNGETLNVAVLPSVVGIGNTDLGLLESGLKGGRKYKKPYSVSINGTNYLVGANVHLYARPRERLDFDRLSEGPELQAMIYASLAQLLGAGEHHLALMVGFPVEVASDKEQAQATLRKLRAWLMGEHQFQVDGQLISLTIHKISAIAQPLGTYFAWALDSQGNWAQPRSMLEAPIAIGDIGFNTIDLYVVQQKQVLGRFTGGDTAGMHRVAQSIVKQVKSQYRISLSLHQADALMRDYLESGQATLYHAGGEADLNQLIEQAVQDTFVEINKFIRQHWEEGVQFRQLIFTGGGAQALQKKLINQYPQAIILPSAVTTNAEGMAKFAAKLFKKLSIPQPKLQPVAA